MVGKILIIYFPNGLIIVSEHENFMKRNDKLESNSILELMLPP